MKLHEHEEECIQKLGRPFTEVHLWLDRFANVDGCFDPDHRFKTHHVQGIMEVRSKFGYAAENAARLHIISDLKMCGWTDGVGIPKDSKEFVKMFGISIHSMGKYFDFLGIAPKQEDQ